MTAKPISKARRKALQAVSGALSAGIGALAGMTSQSAHAFYDDGWEYLYDAVAGITGPWPDALSGLGENVSDDFFKGGSSIAREIEKAGEKLILAREELAKKREAEALKVSKLSEEMEVISKWAATWERKQSGGFGPHRINGKPHDFEWRSDMWLSYTDEVAQRYPDYEYLSLTEMLSSPTSTSEQYVRFLASLDMIAERIRAELRRRPEFKEIVGGGRSMGYQAKLAGLLATLEIGRAAIEDMIEYRRQASPATDISKLSGTTLDAVLAALAEDKVSRHGRLNALVMYPLGKAEYGDEPAAVVWYRLLVQLTAVRNELRNRLGEVSTHISTLKAAQQLRHSRVEAEGLLPAYGKALQAST